MNAVLFLGAGFSRAVGLPVMSEFFSYARHSNAITKDQKVLLDNLLRKASQANAMISGEHNNLEHILSIALMQSFGSQANDTLYRNVCEVLFKIYRDFNAEKYQLVKNSFKGLIPVDGAIDGHLTIITTNYDVCIDYLLYAHHWNAALPFAWKSVPSPNATSQSLYSRESKNIMLCKLHGSINVFDDPQNGESEIMIHDQVDSVQDFVGDKVEVFERPLVSKAKVGIAPVIIPPTFAKMQYPKFMKNIWHAASEALANADRLCFIGYSFPPTDTYMRYFIASSLMDNIAPEKFTIVDPNAQQIADRLANPDSGFGSHFNQKIESIDKKWIVAGNLIFR